LLLGALALYVVTSAVRLVLLVQDYEFFAGGRLDRAELDALVRREQTLAGVFSAVVLAFVVAYAVWFYVSRRTAERLGANGRETMKHWTLLAWRLALLASVVLLVTTQVTGSLTDLSDLAVVDRLMAFDRQQIFYTVARILTAGLLVAGVLVVRRRIWALATGTLPPEHRAYAPSPVPDNPFDEHWSDYRNRP
jgi:hypothetical protein